MLMIAVRHGTAEPKRGWKGRDQDRPLISSGDRQAKALSARLTRYRPARILSSPSLRCRQTVEPLAAACELPVDQTDALAPDAGLAATCLIHQIVRSEASSSTVVLCTHREVLVDLLPALATEFGVNLSHRLPGAKGSYWLLLFRNEKLIKVTYRRPAV